LRIPLRPFLVLSAGFGLSLAACAPESVTPTTGAARPMMAAAVAGNSYVILGKGNKLPANLAAAVAAAGGTVTSTIPAIGMAVATSGSATFQAQAAAISGVQAVALDAEYQFIDPNERVVEITDDATGQSIGDNETFFPGVQWGPQAIHAPEAWDAGARGAGVRVAVLDGGLNDTHIDLVGQVDVARSASFVPGVPNFFDDVGNFSHATHVAGIIAAADNSVGTIGVAPGATIIGVKVLHNGSGAFSWIINGIIYAATPISQGGGGANIINMSLGGAFDRQGKDAAHLAVAMSRATNYAYQQGVTVIASAGNSGIDLDHTNNLITLPAQATNVIAVAATGPFGWALGATDFTRPASYTNFGQSAVSHAAPGGDFALPGSAVCSRPRFPTGSVVNFCWVFDMVLSPGSRKGFSNTSYSWAAGTSMAAPHVAGVAALIIEKAGGYLHPAQVKARLGQTSDDLGKPGNDDYYGGGFVNALRAIQ